MTDGGNCANSVEEVREKQCEDEKNAGNSRDAAERSEQAEMTNQAKVWSSNYLARNGRNVKSPTLWINFACCAIEVWTDLQRGFDDDCKNSCRSNSNKQSAFNLLDHQTDDEDQTKCKDNNWPANEVAVITKHYWNWSRTGTTNETGINKTDQSDEETNTNANCYLQLSRYRAEYRSTEASEY